MCSPYRVPIAPLLRMEERALLLLLRFHVYRWPGCQSRRKLLSPLPIFHGEDHLGLCPIFVVLSTGVEYNWSSARW